MQYTWHCGFCSFRYLEQPPIVPPVPVTCIKYHPQHRLLTKVDGCIQWDPCRTTTQTMAYRDNKNTRQLYDNNSSIPEEQMKPSTR